MPNSARRTFFAGTLIVVSEGISDWFASRRAASKMSWVSIARGSHWDEIRPSASRPSRTPAKGFSSRGRCGAGDGLLSDVSPRDIARPGVLVRSPPARRPYPPGPDDDGLERADVAAVPAASGRHL